ncbi:MAG: hydrogenase iron-sulfur subunit, partial [Deltaproteobacteria bacterium]|nr:hydrogenase iron-sulfur subunit [Deltaproteobacteria bacterium]
DGVLVTGCHPGDCHYETGNYLARRRAAVLKSLLEFLGIEEERIHFSWVSAAEGAKFSQLVEEVTKRVKRLGPSRRLVKIDG